ncbi:MAG: DUF4260 domain-containing protein [Bacteroidota bacterium]
MKNILKLEELAMFAISIYFFSLLPYAWWVFPALLLTPDIGLVGYAWNAKVGAWVYNIFHHKGLAIFIGAFGFVENVPLCLLAGIILFAHASFDRILGYGLKYNDSFAHTHLGQLKKSNSQ